MIYEKYITGKLKNSSGIVFIFNDCHEEGDTPNQTLKGSP